MRIRLIEGENGDDLPLYERLVREHGTVFNSGEWGRLFGNRLLRFGIYETGGELIGGFCLYRDDRFGFPIFRNLPFAPMCGPFIDIKAKNPTNILETKRKALAEMAHLLDGKRYSIISIALDRCVDDALPFYWKKFKVIPHYTYIIDLRTPVETIKQQMSASRKRSISKARNDGLFAQKITDMTIVRNFVLNTFQRKQKKINTQYLDAILFKFANESNSFAFATYCNGDPVACSFIVHDTRTAYYLLGGHTGESKHSEGAVLPLLESILLAKEVGLQTFDFEGSMAPSIERFIRGFGGKLTPYLTVNKAWIPIEMALKTIKRELF
jgi:hypothetical protein